MDIKKSLGEKIKRLRKKRKLTQEQLAEIIDIAPRNLCKIEIGESFVKADTLERLLLALDVTTEELFSNDHIKDSKELMTDIYKALETVKTNEHQLEKIYRMIKFFLEK